MCADLTRLASKGPLNSIAREGVPTRASVDKQIASACSQPVVLVESYRVSPDTGGWLEPRWPFEVSALQPRPLLGYQGRIRASDDCLPRTPIMRVPVIEASTIETFLLCRL